MTPRSTSRRLLLASSLALASFSLASVSPRAALADDPTSEPKAAQPMLATVPLRIVGSDGRSHDFTVELARTPREQQVGLMFRHAVAADGGMLFVWAEPQVSQMWMENTLVPLDMVFIGADGRVRSIADDTVPQSLAIISSGAPVVATLELAAGTAARLGITVGDHVICRALPNAG